MESQQLSTTKKSELLPFVSDSMNTLNGMKELASQILTAGIAPAHFYEKTNDNKPDHSKPKIGVFIAVVMHGHELGLSMSSAMQDIVPVHGRMSIMGDAAKSLVFASGLVDTFEEEITGSIQKEDYCVTYKAKRKDGKGGTWTRSFSVAEAKRAALWVPETAEARLKQGVWYKYPQRMIMYRALGALLKDAFPEPLKGTNLYEYLMNVDDVEVTVVDTKINGGKDTAAAESAASIVEKVITDSKINAAEPVEEKPEPNAEAQPSNQAGMEDFGSWIKMSGFEEKMDALPLQYGSDWRGKVEKQYHLGGAQGAIDFMEMMIQNITSALASGAEAIRIPGLTTEVTFDEATGKYSPDDGRGPAEIKEIKAALAKLGMTKELFDEALKEIKCEFTSSIDVAQFCSIKELETIAAHVVKNKK